MLPHSKSLVGGISCQFIEVFIKTLLGLSIQMLALPLGEKNQLNGLR